MDICIEKKDTGMGRHYGKATLPPPTQRELRGVIFSWLRGSSKQKRGCINRAVRICKNRSGFSFGKAVLSELRYAGEFRGVEGEERYRRALCQVDCRCLGWADFAEFKYRKWKRTGGWVVNIFSTNEVCSEFERIEVLTEQEVCS